MSTIEFSAPLQMYDIVGRDVMQDQRKADIDARTAMRNSIREPKCQKMYEGQLPFPSTPRLYCHYDPLPLRSDSISRVRMLEQRDRQFASVNSLNPVARVQTNLQYNIDNDPRFHQLQDGLSSGQVVTTSQPQNEWLNVVCVPRSQAR